MVIKSDKGVRDEALLGLGCLLMIFVLIWWESKNVMAALLTIAMPIFILTRGWISGDRKLALDEEGCEVTFLWYSKKYKWRDFKIKQVVNYDRAIGYLNVYKKGVIFSTKRVRKPKWLKTAEYSALIHPWSVIYVDFYPDKMPDLGYKYPHCMATDEKKFMDKMREWNVELEGVE